MNARVPQPRGTNGKKKHNRTRRPLVAKLAPRRFMDVTSPVWETQEIEEFPWTWKRNISRMLFFFSSDFCVKVMGAWFLDFVNIGPLLFFLSKGLEWFLGDDFLLQNVFFVFFWVERSSKKVFGQPLTSKAGNGNWWWKDLGLSSL